MLLDKDIREPLKAYLKETFQSPKFLEEKQIGSSRADMLMLLEDAMVGIEIKSDADSYTRLSRQVKDYNLHFDYNMVVVGSTHAHHIEEQVPAWWGIITVDEMEDGADFYCLRKMRPNPEVNLKLKLSLLWRPELANIQEAHGMHKYAYKSKAWVIDKIAETIAEEELHRDICEQFYLRDYEKMLEEMRQYRLEHGKKARRKKTYRRGRKTLTKKLLK